MTCMARYTVSLPCMATQVRAKSRSALWRTVTLLEPDSFTEHLKTEAVGLVGRQASNFGGLTQKGGKKMGMMDKMMDRMIGKMSPEEKEKMMWKMMPRMMKDVNMT